MKSFCLHFAANTPVFHFVSCDLWKYCLDDYGKIRPVADRTLFDFDNESVGLYTFQLIFLGHLKSHNLIKLKFPS